MVSEACQPDLKRIRPDYAKPTNERGSKRIANNVRFHSLIARITGGEDMDANSLPGSQPPVTPQHNTDQRRLSEILLVTFRERNTNRTARQEKTSPKVRLLR
jgi:hypothetical protein